MTVTVAIPVRNGGEQLRLTLEAVRAQQLDCEVELLVCDSGSTDGSIARARELGANVIQIPPATFSHGGTRNLLMERARGAHVAFITQDALPADERWLAKLVGGFEMAENVGLTFGPYLPRPGASLMIERELREWFHAFSPDGTPRVDQLAPGQRELPSGALLGPRGFFSDANGCIARRAWEAVPFRPVPYAEDHALAHDMLRAGFAKVYVPDAAVIHSHDYSDWNWLRRGFDEGRAMHALYGLDEPRRLLQAALRVWGSVGADWRWARAHDRAPVSAGRGGLLLVRSLSHHFMRTLGARLGQRADRLPPWAVARLSLEGRRD